MDRLVLLILLSFDLSVPLLLLGLYILLYLAS